MFSANPADIVRNAEDVCAVGCLGSHTALPAHGEGATRTGHSCQIKRFWQVGVCIDSEIADIVCERSGPMNKGPVYTQTDGVHDTGAENVSLANREKRAFVILPVTV